MDVKRIAGALLLGIIMAPGISACATPVAESDWDSYEPHTPEPVEVEPNIPDYEELDRGRLETTCRDVTSYDQNWDNDVLCTRPDGTQFYTSYEGAGW